MSTVVESLLSELQACAHTATDVLLSLSSEHCSQPVSCVASDQPRQGSSQERTPSARQDKHCYSCRQRGRYSLVLEAKFCSKDDTIVSLQAVQSCFHSCQQRRMMVIIVCICLWLLCSLIIEFASRLTCSLGECSQGAIQKRQKAQERAATQPTEPCNAVGQS